MPRVTHHEELSASYRGRVPTIVVFNRAATPLGVKLDALIAAMQKFVDEHFAPVWGTPAKLKRSPGFRKGAWAFVFLERYKDGKMEGFHDVTPEGLPMSKVYVVNTLNQGDQVSIAASHELAEMLVDPGANLYSTGPKGNRMYDYEVADPVEELSFDVDGIAMTNFVYPSYFEAFHKKGATRFDHMEKLKRPFELLEGGYQGFFSGGKERTLWGSKAKKARFALEDRRGHRSEVRKKPGRKLSVG